MKKRAFLFALGLFLFFISLGGYLTISPPASAAPSVMFAAKQAARRDIRTILADQRFAYPDSWAGWNKFWSRFFHWITWLNQRRPVQKFPGGLFWNRALNHIGLVLLLLSPFVLAFLLPRMFQKETVLKIKTPADNQRAPNVSELMGKAAGFAGRGLPLEAIRHVYWAVLEHFKELGLLRRDGNDTDKANLAMMRNRLGSQHRVYLSYAALIRLFQEKWYGLNKCRPEDYETALRLAETIMESAGKHHA